MNTIGERVKTLRLEKGWSEEELVAQMDIELPVVCITNLEAGRTNPDYKNLRYLPELAKALETNIHYLMDGKSLQSILVDRYVDSSKDLYVVGVDKGDKLDAPENATLQAKVTRVLD